jgi:hypothetical protein
MQQENRGCEWIPAIRAIILTYFRLVDDREQNGAADWPFFALY